MDKFSINSFDNFFKAVLTLKSLDEAHKFFEDVCTVKEMLDISQRLKAAKMLASGAVYADISAETGMSTATISRVSKCLEYGAGGYRAVLERRKATSAESNE